jgi:succinoglycan biosynthesis transport protein ExoP
MLYNINYAVYSRTLPNIEEELKRAQENPVDEATNAKMVELAKTLELSKRLEVVIPAKVVEEATLPLKPGNLPLWVNALLGIMLGLMSGIFGAFIVEYLDDNLNSVHDIKRGFKLPILGEIPFEIKNTSLNPDDKIKSHFSEAFSMLFTYLSFMSQGKPLKSIVVTSPGPNDGKTSVSIGLGEALALRGKRVLIIDADMRKAGLSKINNFSDHKGLSSLLASSDKADEYILTTGTVFILPCGIIPPNPAELLYLPKMKQTLDELSSQYDLIIIDTPPMIGFAEALTLAQLVDGVVVVARINNTRRNALQKAIEVFQGPNIKLFGLVVNGVKHGHKDAYYYYKY